MLEKDRIMQIPTSQKMERQETLAREHSEEYEAALQRAVALDIPQASSPPSYGTFHEMEEGETSSQSTGEASTPFFKKWKESWDSLVERLFEVDESGQMVFRKSSSKKSSNSSTLPP